MSRRSISMGPGPVPSVIPSSCLRPSCGWRWTSTVTAAATTSTAYPMRFRPPTANYLVRSGWRGDEPWGYEVKLPQGFDESLAGRKKRRPLAGGWR